MTWRSAHGNARRLGALAVVETCPADELPPAMPLDTARPARGPDGRFLPGNTVARAQRLRPGLRGVVGALAPDPAFRSFLVWGRRYAIARRAELARMHGGELSTGVGTLVESAGQAIAAARFVAAKGAQTGDATMLAQAARLSEQAKQLELSAWELASREAAARPQADPLEAVRLRIAAAAPQPPQPAPVADPVADPEVSR